MKEELISLSAHELIEHFGRRSLSPVEVMHDVLESVESLDPVVNSLCAVDAERALAAARQSEQRWKDGNPCGPLDGVPVSVKDMIAVAGLPTRHGSITTPAEPERTDAPAVARLREAGALLFGKTTTSEFGNKIVTDSPLTGTTRNPWNTDLSPGGSSGGSAVAVAVGFGPLSLATDGGGSIRIPACWSGVVGFKPSTGRVPAGAASSYTGLSTLGPMARCVSDAIRMMDVLTGMRAGARSLTDLCDLQSEPCDHPSELSDGARGLRIAWCAAPAGVTVERSVADCVQRAVAGLEGLGADIDGVTLEPLADYACGGMHSLQWSVYFAHRVRQMTPQQRALLDPDLSALARAGEEVETATLVQALADRHRLTVAMSEFFTRYDLLLTPTFHVGPPPVPGLPRHLQCAPALTSWCNQTGVPAASVPCGITAAGVPTGLQITGALGADALVLRIAHAYELSRGLPAPSPLLQRAGLAAEGARA